MVCLILTLLNFIMILQICLSLSVNNKAQVLVSLQMQVVAKSSTRILLLIVEACSTSHAFSPNTLKIAKNASSNVWTPLSVSQSILKALSRRWRTSALSVASFYQGKEERKSCGKCTIRSLPYESK